MATLSISNFLSIKKAKIPLRRINIFIGPQAQGKSVISKLIYFFKDIPFMIYDEVGEGVGKRKFESLCRVQFENIFPSYAWERNAFAIVYDAGCHKIIIENQLLGNKLKFSIVYSESIGKALAAGRRAIKLSSSMDNSFNMIHRSRPNTGKMVREAVTAALYGENGSRKLEEVIYIPAGRSFFSNLQKSLFSFISSNIPIDYFLKEFGSVYEASRESTFLRGANRARPKNVQKIVDELLCGKYVHDKGQDWIEGERGRVNLSNSSSGQQEVLPMAMVLSSLPYATSAAFLRSFVIEEPEAHLFPVAQGQVVSLIASAYNAGMSSGDFVITTHSPYILTALNNLIQADNTVRSFDDAELANVVYDIIPVDEHVKFEDVAAFIVDSGHVRSILDPEYRLIQAEVIDGVSDHFSTRFEKLIEIEMSNSEEGRDDLI